MWLREVLIRQTYEDKFMPGKYSIMLSHVFEELGAVARSRRSHDDLGHMHTQKSEIIL